MILLAAAKAGLPVLKANRDEFDVIQHVTGGAVGPPQPNVRGVAGVAKFGLPHKAAHHGLATMPAVAHDFIVGTWLR